jgi:flagellar assembly protein FliH
METETETDKEQTSAAGFMSQVDYVPTAFEHSEWEALDERFDPNIFVPLKVEVFARAHTTVDPMFADFGGLPPAREEQWHLPDGESYKVEGTQAAAEGVAAPVMSDTELAAIRSAAAEEARTAALQEAEALRQIELQALSTRYQTLFDDFLKQQQEVRTDLERQTLEFAIQLSKRILDTTVEINPEYIVPLVKEALRKAGTAKIGKVRVSPPDLEFIQVLGIEKKLKEFDGSWQFEADASIKAGCVVETSAGEVDFDLESAWNRVKDEVVRVCR